MMKMMMKTIAMVIAIMAMNIATRDEYGISSYEYRACLA